MPQALCLAIQNAYPGTSNLYSTNLRTGGATDYAETGVKQNKSTYESAVLAGAAYADDN
jgi:uncharacterized protein YraI